MKSPNSALEKLGDLIESLRQALDRSESLYQQLRADSWPRIAEIVGNDSVFLEPVFNQVVHDLVALVLARGFSVDDILQKEFPRVLRRWSARENWPEAEEVSAEDPEEMTLEDEQCINRERRTEGHNRLRKEAYSSAKPRGPEAANEEVVRPVSWRSNVRHHTNYPVTPRTLR